MASGDLDRDGDIDIRFSRESMIGRTLENRVNNGQYLKLNIKGTVSNRDGIGAKIFLYESGFIGNNENLLGMRTVNGGSGFNSMSSRIVHFGFPDMKSKDILIHFPSGIRKEVLNLTPGATYAVYEQDGAARKAAYFKKWIIRNVRSPIIQKKGLFLLAVLLALFFTNGVFYKRSWWDGRIALFSILLPAMVFLTLFLILHDSGFIFGHIFPLTVSLVFFNLGIYYGRKVYGKMDIRFEYYEKLFLATNSFFHGEWGARKLNRLQLYCTNVDLGEILHEELKENLKEAVKDIFGLVIPEIERIVSYAKAAHLSDDLQSSIKHLIQSLSNDLNKLKVDLQLEVGLQKDVLNNIVETIQRFQGNLRSIRNRIADQFTCNVREILEGSVNTAQTQDIKIGYNSMVQDEVLARIPPSSFSQIMENLIENAIRAVENRTGKMVSVTLNCNADLIFVDVADNGNGIPAEIEAKLFKEQVTTKYKSGGFGLYHAAKELEKYGGTIKLMQNGPDKETVIQLQLKRIDNG